jgi:hypothetical protein
MGIEFHENGAGSIVGNEFASVSVSLDTGGNSPRLRVEDLRTGRVRYLDALELETLVWLPDESLTALMDPSRDRWRGEP